MKIYLGADHRGFSLKNDIKQYLLKEKYEVVDLGNTQLDPNDDYPDFSLAVAKKVSENSKEDKGIVICGSGGGVMVVANKLPGIRSALALLPEQAFSLKNDDDVNVLSLASDFTKTEDALRIINVWLKTSFSGAERHKRRINKIAMIEKGFEDKTNEKVGILRN